MHLQIDLRSNYERKTDGIGHLMKHAEIVRMRTAAPALQVSACNESTPHPLSCVCVACLASSEQQTACLPMMAHTLSIYRNPSDAAETAHPDVCDRSNQLLRLIYLPGGLKPPPGGAAEAWEARVARPQGCAAGGAPPLPAGAQPVLRQVHHEPALWHGRQDRVLDGAAESAEGDLHRNDVSPGAQRLSGAFLVSARCLIRSFELMCLQRSRKMSTWVHDM